MAQAAKQLRKNKDLEAQAEQERKEKEEEKVKKRSRSRDKKRKVLGPGGVLREGLDKRGGGEGVLCHANLLRADETHMETQSRVCFHCVCTQHPWKHMYVLRIQTRGNGNTPHALLLSTVLSFREDSVVTPTVSPSLVTSLSLPLLSHCSMVFFSQQNFSFMETACQFLQEPRTPSQLFVCAAVMTAEPDLQPPV